MAATKNLLIIGGTRQIGKRLLEYLEEQQIDDWSITVFNRGNNSLPAVHQPIRQIIGDRNTNDIDQIGNQDLLKWVYKGSPLYKPIKM